MNPNDFDPDQRANCQLQLEGYDAFLPPTLPPKLSIDWKLATSDVKSKTRQ